MTAPDWAALVQQTRDRIDQAEKTAKAATSGAVLDRYPHGGGRLAVFTQDSRALVADFYGSADREHYVAWSPDVALRMVAWARDVLDRHTTVTALTTEDCRYTGCCWDGCEVWSCAACGHIERDDEDFCPDRLSVLRAWVPDLLAAAGDEP